MAKTLDQRLAAAKLIKDETIPNANTAPRVGGAMEDINNAWNEELGEINVTTAFPPTSGYHTPETARAAVPDSYKRKGRTISYQTAAGTWVKEQYRGDSTAAWTTASNWFPILMAADQNVYNVTIQNPLAAGEYYNPTTARAAVPNQIRKLNLGLKYLSGYKEVDTLTITGPALTDGSISIFLNGVKNTASPVIYAGDTAIDIATKIRLMTWAGWTVGGTPGTAVVTFTRTTYDPVSAPTFSSTAGITANFVRTSTGQTPEWVHEEFIGPSTASWTTATNWRKLATATDLAQIETNLNTYNVTVAVPLTAGSYYNKTTARAAVPSVSRKLGLVITYSTSVNTWYTERFIGSNISGWDTESNWEQVPDAAQVASMRSDLKAVSDKLAHISYSIVNGDTEDVISDKFKKGSLVKVATSNEQFYIPYGFTGPTMDQPWNDLSSDIYTDGIILDKDYYLIRLYNSHGIGKQFTIWLYPNLETISNKVDSLYTDVDVLQSDVQDTLMSSDFKYQNMYGFWEINVGDRVYNLKPVYNLNGIHTANIYLSKGKTMYITGLNIASDIRIMYVVSAETNICLEKIDNNGLTNVSYTATENCIIAFSTWSNDTKVTIQKQCIAQSVANNFFHKDVVYYGNPFDYITALQMDRGVLRGWVETASNGCCTVIYDDNGYPSLMYKIPLISIGVFDARLGDVHTPHPAFIVNGETKKCIYAAVFMNCTYNGVPVSWWGLSSDGYGQGRGNFDQIKQMSSAKGNGWHMQTIWEHSLISLLSAKYHNYKPRGNDNRGASSVVGYEYECVQLKRGKCPPVDSSEGHGFEWINGTQPDTWSHNNSRWGIFDIIGGYWERYNLLKTDSQGRIFMCLDNSYNSEESSWVDTGANIAYQNNKIVFSTSQIEVISNIRQTKWTDVVNISAYDVLSEDIRKKLSLALVVPRLSSQDVAALFNFDGEIWYSSVAAYPFGNGADAYNGYGIGAMLLSYDKTQDHGNIGSRLFYIE